MVEALIRSGSRTGGNFQPIGMEEALRTATMWLSPLVHQTPQAITMCVGRDADFQLACDWMERVGSQNIFADRALSAATAAKPRSKNKRTSLVLAFGSGMGRGGGETLGRLATMRKQGAKIISINPVKTGLSALADQWLSINPGTDHLLLDVLLGRQPCNYQQLAETGLSVIDVEKLLCETGEIQNQITIIAGRGIFSHVNGSPTAAQINEMFTDILPAADHTHMPRNLSKMLDKNCEAFLCMNSSLPWHSQPAKALENFEGRVVCLSEKPDGFEACADLVFCGKAEDNLIALAARLGQKDFSDVEGNSPYANGYADYEPMGAKLPAVKFPLQPQQEIDSDGDFPFHAISQKAHADANRSIVFMNASKAAFMGLKNKDVVQLKSPHGQTRAIIALMHDMNENTVWSWGSTLFAPLIPEDKPLRDPTTGQPAWFDLKVAVEKVEV